MMIAFAVGNAGKGHRTRLTGPPSAWTAPSTIETEKGTRYGGFPFLMAFFRFRPGTAHCESGAGRRREVFAMPGMAAARRANADPWQFFAVGV